MLNIQRFVCNPFQENTYIVSDETHDAVIIDCGVFFQEERKALVNYISEQHLQPRHLLVTHGHIDHNFGNNTIFEQYGLKPEVSAADEPLMHQLAEQSIAFINYELDYELPAVEKYLVPTDIITFGSHRLCVIPTPGHTPGGCFFYCAEEKLAFSGDTLFRMSVGRTDFELGSYTDLSKSLECVVNTLPHDTTILCGHGPQTTLADEIRYNPYLKKINVPKHLVISE